MATTINLNNSSFTKITTAEARWQCDRAVFMKLNKENKLGVYKILGTIAVRTNEMEAYEAATFVTSKRFNGLVFVPSAKTEFLTTEDVAKKLDVDVQTVLKGVAKRELPVCRLGARLLRFPLEMIQAFEQACRV